MEMYLADSITYHIKGGADQYGKNKVYEVEPIKIVPYKTILTEKEMAKLINILSNIFVIERKWNEKRINRKTS